MVVLYIFVMVQSWNKWCGVCVHFQKTAFHMVSMELEQLNWNNTTNQNSIQCGLIPHFLPQSKFAVTLIVFSVCP